MDGVRHWSLRPGLVVLCLTLANTPVRAADRSAPIGVPFDTIAPTSPRGFAADLPRSPLADAIVNGSLRFATVAEARHRCPGDDVVKVETWSNVYRPASTPGAGAYMCKAAALQEGDRPR